MKTKKSQKANLENKRGLFFQIGFVLVLAVILVAFEWSTRVGKVITYEPKDGDEEIEISIPITRPEQEQENKVKPPAIVFTPIVVPDDKPDIEDTWVPPTDDYADSIIWNIESKPEVVDEPTYWDVDIKPKFMGKDDRAFREYIIKNIKFPEDARIIGLTGKVQVQFVVETDGTLSQIKVLRGVHQIIDQEVVRVIGNSPKWEPGFYNGKYVKTMYGIVIQFKLE
jgi:protein TonB